MSLRFVTIGLLLAVSFVLADPTMYKKNEQNMYEPGRLSSDFDQVNSKESSFGQ